MKKFPFTAILFFSVLLWSLIEFPVMRYLLGFLFLAPFILLGLLILFLVWAMKRGRLRQKIDFRNQFSAKFGGRPEEPVYKDVEIKVVDK